MENGEPHGDGAYTYKDGEKYVGGWKDGERHGDGAYTYKDGTKYVGGWKDGDQYGYGAYIDKNRTSYLGEWDNGDRKKKVERYKDVENYHEIEKNVKGIEEKVKGIEEKVKGIDEIVEENIVQNSKIQLTEVAVNKEAHAETILEWLSNALGRLCTSFKSCLGVAPEAEPERMTWIKYIETDANCTQLTPKKGGNQFGQNNIENTDALLQDKQSPFNIKNSYSRS